MRWLGSGAAVSQLMAATIVTVAAIGCGSDDPTAPTPRRPELTELLAHYDELFDPSRNMLSEEYDSPGYHTRIETGTRVHPIRESLIYSLALLQRGAEGDALRAAGILETVLRLQDRDPSSATQGVWPWLLEEPLAEMDSPDLNWADFCSAQLVQMLKQHADHLPSELQSEMRTSVMLACDAIRRRNVGPGYSNIAILGGGVCAAAGELLGDENLLSYGRTRLQKVVEHVARHGGFNEYNSPPYAKVVIAECERTLQLVTDSPTRKAADALRRRAWKMVAESFHPGTQQWAGPHSRTSRDRLRRSTVQFLSHRIRSPLDTHPTMADGAPRGYAVVEPVDCPEELISTFHRRIAKPYETSRTFVKARDSRNSRTGTTWFSDEACLGSVNRSSFWAQRKPLIAYWKTDDDPAVVFRMRFLHDGRDFASMGVRTEQRGPRALALLHILPGRGDWHPSLDRPGDGVFQVSDFRWRFELRGRNVKVEEYRATNSGTSPSGVRVFELSAGAHRIVIHPAESEFLRQRVKWETGQSADSVFVDAVCYSGPSTAFEMTDPYHLSVGAGLELLQASQPLDVSRAHVTSSSAGPAAKWKLTTGDTIQVGSP